MVVRQRIPYVTWTYWSSKFYYASSQNQFPPASKKRETEQNKTKPPTGLYHVAPVLYFLASKPKQLNFFFRFSIHPSGAPRSLRRSFFHFTKKNTSYFIFRNLSDQNTNIHRLTYEPNLDFGFALLRISIFFFLKQEKEGL